MTWMVAFFSIQYVKSCYVENRNLSNGFYQSFQYRTTAILKSLYLIDFMGNDIVTNICILAPSKSALKVCLRQSVLRAAQNHGSLTAEFYSVCGRPSQLRRVRIRLLLSYAVWRENANIYQKVISHKINQVQWYQIDCSSEQKTLVFRFTLFCNAAET